MQTSLHGIIEAAKKNKRKRFRSLYGCFNLALLEESYRELNKDAAAGIDSVTYEEYGKDLQRNLIDLENRLKRKAYHAKLVRRVYIPKASGGQRPLGIPALEDKIVQNLARRILELLFEPLFLDCSYAYRPGRSARQAVEELQDEIRNKYVWVVEADIKSFFDTINHDLLIEMVEKRVDDRAFVYLIRKWLNAGVLNADKTVERPQSGTPQGGVISPILANIYLHFVLDVWFTGDVGKKYNGEAHLTRYADDFVAAFRYHRDAASFLRRLKNRLEKYSLKLAQDKTRKLMFNRFRKSESEVFSFLGFEFRWATSRKGNDHVCIRTDSKRCRRIVREFKEWCKSHRHKRIAWIMGMVKAKLRGLRNYFGVIGNSDFLRNVNLLFRKTLYRWLNRRSERKSYAWPTFSRIWEMYNVSSLRRLDNEGLQLSLVPYLCAGEHTKYE
jgi:group II intron reverse transcriptase/maturase